MATLHIPYFDEIDKDSVEDYYEADIELNGQSISLDINLDDDPPANWADLYTKYAGKLNEYEVAIRRIIKGYYPEEGMVREFFTYHQEELPDEMKELFNNTDQSLSEDDRLMAMLKLDRIGFYFDRNNFATWDFSFGDFTDQILVIITDGKGEILDITWES